MRSLEFAAGVRFLAEPPASRPANSDHAFFRMSQYDEDLKASKLWLVNIVRGLNLLASRHEAECAHYIDKLVLVAECAQLPGDAPLRIRCTPHVFGFKA